MVLHVSADIVLLEQDVDIAYAELASLSEDGSASFVDVLRPCAEMVLLRVLIPNHHKSRRKGAERGLLLGALNPRNHSHSGRPCTRR